MPIIYRENQNRPLTNAELDENFRFLDTEVGLRLLISDFVAENISTALNTPAVTDETPQTTLELAETNSLNAWLVRDLIPTSTLPVILNKSSLVARDSSGTAYLDVIGDLQGNATTATTADVALVANSLANTYTVPIVRGGTGANNATDARANLNVLALDGELRMTGPLKSYVSNLANASIKMGVGVNPDTVSLENGDIWSTSTGIRYRISNTNFTIASLESPSFTGIPTAPHPSGNNQIATLLHLSDLETSVDTKLSLKSDIESPTFIGTPIAPTPPVGNNTTRIATTAFVKSADDAIFSTLTTNYESYTDSEITTLNTSLTNSINLKANINSPTFTGTPSAPTPGVDDNSTKIATTSYTRSRINSSLTSYYTKSQIDSTISNLSSTLTSSINLKANISSPTFTGTPAAPTPAVGNNTTQIATTAFVKAADDAIFSALTTNYQNYVNSLVGGLGSTTDNGLNLKANIASPSFTGTPTAPAPSVGDNSGRIATTSYTVAQINSSLGNYYTKSQIDSFQPLWGNSRKFVQSGTPSGAVAGDFWFVI